MIKNDKLKILGDRDPGILRKKAKSNTDNDFFVFGYSCKLFRDDAKAKQMDQGKQLIPWMGDDTTTIDRYDARGHLSERSQFEKSNEEDILTDEEKRIEDRCNEERYRALEENEEERDMYQEEELKRLKKALSTHNEYAQVGYNYPEPSVPDPAEDYEPFQPDPCLDIPPNMVLPMTVTQNCRVEKTAGIVASYGSQVEIVIKTRQANNYKLSFMHIDDPLNPYYNFILSQIKSGRYRPKNDTQADPEDMNDDEDAYYLHPSLLGSTSVPVESAPSIPSIAIKPSTSNCYYQLIKNIKEMQKQQEEGRDSVSSVREARARDNGHVTKPSNVPMELKPPPPAVCDVMARLIRFAKETKMHPTTVAKDLCPQGNTTWDFVNPGNVHYGFYVQQIKEANFEEFPSVGMSSLRIKRDRVRSSSPAPHSSDSHSSMGNGKYDPALPTEDDNMDGEDDEYLVSQEEDGSESVKPSANHPRPPPVSFAIKKPLEKKNLDSSSFPIESSSEEDEDGTKQDKPATKSGETKSSKWQDASPEEKQEHKEEPEQLDLLKPSAEVAPTLSLVKSSKAPVMSEAANTAAPRQSLLQLQPSLPDLSPDSKSKKLERWKKAKEMVKTMKFPPLLNISAPKAKKSEASGGEGTSANSVKSKTTEALASSSTPKPVEPAATTVGERMIEEHRIQVKERLQKLQESLSPIKDKGRPTTLASAKQHLTFDPAILARVDKITQLADVVSTKPAAEAQHPEPLSNRLLDCLLTSGQLMSKPEIASPSESQKYIQSISTHKRSHSHVTSQDTEHTEQPHKRHKHKKKSKHKNQSSDCQYISSDSDNHTSSLKSKKKKKKKRKHSHSVRFKLRNSQSHSEQSEDGVRNSHKSKHKSKRHKHDRERGSRRRRTRSSSDSSSD